MDNRKNTGSNNVKLGFNEKASYVFYGFTISAVDGVIASFLMFFYTDIFMLTAPAIAALFTIARVWDGLNDPIMGYIVDKTDTKYGKFKPYVLAGTLGMFLFGILTFYVPNLSVTGKIAWAFVTYIGLGMTQTVTQIPYNALPAVMTSNSQERTKLLSIAKIMTTISSLAAGMLVQPLMKALGGGNDKKGLMLTVLIVMAVQLCAGFYINKGVKERVAPSKDKIRLQTVFSDLWQNKPALIMMVLGFLRKPIFTITLSTLVYFVTYNIGKQSLMIVFMGAYGIASLLGMIVLPFFTGKLGQKKTYMLYSLMPAVSGAIFYAVGYKSLVVSLILASLGAFFAVAPDIITRSMLFDAIDFGEWKTGRRAEGVTYSIVTCSQKIASGLSSALVVMLLAAAGYVGGADTQSDSAIKGIFMIHIIFPALISFVSVFIMMLYKMSDREHSEIIEELEMRRQTTV